MRLSRLGRNVISIDQLAGAIDESFLTTCHVHTKYMACPES